jgi:uncharacterized membrane protein YeiB
MIGILTMNIMKLKNKGMAYYSTIIIRIVYSDSISSLIYYYNIKEEYYLIFYILYSILRLNKSKCML